MTWTKPTYEGRPGGENITGYIIEYRYEGTTNWIEDGRPTELAWSFKDLEVGRKYDVRCAAFNDIGTGDYAQYPSLILIDGEYDNECENSSAKSLFSSALLALFACPLLV